MIELNVLVEAIAVDLGDPANWVPPVEFPDSLALCALNSSYSLRASTAAANNVLDQYRALRPTANTDSGLDLIAAMDAAGGPVTFAAAVLDNKSKLPGTMRVRPEGIYEGLTKLAALKAPVTTAEQLRNAVAGDDSSAERAWRSVKGFGPLAWSYLIMNAGVTSETKPDVMVQRYLKRALGGGKKLTAARTRELLQLAAAELSVTPRALDRAIWKHESPSR
ncbi:MULTISPECIES: hypothetical protein [Arthrobacter]|uniref:HhH-GPD domain-containing protein n=2 Tax=Arthrobacter TaxID=1663 RepID=A0ABU9KI89_9MICC|nr:hypothetical protein [Arthrobacter sp. YJM1]MDP5225871.1 hypothetical protein [Arthrobacter sp. YJM1]